MWIPLAVVAVLVLGVVVIYNGLVRLRVQCDNAWADIDVQLKRRHDLVPNVVETVKGYAAHERETLDAVVAARSHAMAAHSPGAKAEAEGMLTQALKSLFALAEAYPQLRAVESFTQLQTTLGQIEEAIQPSGTDFASLVQLRDAVRKVILRHCDEPDIAELVKPEPVPATRGGGDG
jgi:LemA protein